MSSQQHRPSVPIARSLRELTSIMEDQMSTHYSEVVSNRRASFKSNRVKSQLLEAHLPDKSPDAALLALQSLVKREDRVVGATVVLTTAEPTQDERLFVLRGRSKDEDVVFYVDVTDRRFWVIHSLDKARIVRNRLNALASTLGRGFDNVWFSIDTLNATKSFGYRRGVRINFVDHLGGSRSGQDESSPDEFTMLLKSARVDDELDFLNSTERSPFASRVAVSASLIRAIDPDDKRQFALEDIYHSGLFTARGTSAARHLQVLQVMKTDYSNFINDLEQGRAVRWVDGRPLGEIIVISLTRQDLSAESLVTLLSSGEKPFSFWGLPRRLADDHYTAELIDLHHGNYGNPLTVEVSSKWIRVVLPRGTCGNAICRLLSNLQHSVDSGARLIVGETNSNDGDRRSPSA